jgi:uncharacterized protein (TIGR00369 family)
LEAVNNGLDGRLFAYLQKSVKETAYYKLLRIQLQSLAPGNAEFRVEAGPEHTNPMGLIHGGLITSLADAAMGNAVRSLGIKGVTVDMSTAFIAAARVGDTIFARGKVLKSGKNLIFTEALIYAGDNLAGHGKATFYKTADIRY